MSTQTNEIPTPRSDYAWRRVGKDGYRALYLVSRQMEAENTLLHHRISLILAEAEQMRNLLAMGAVRDGARLGLTF